MSQFVVNLVEFQRLQSLLPVELQPEVAIVRAKKAKPALISTKKVNTRRFTIQIDLTWWQELNSQQRDLLFWHEVARIQNRTVVIQWERTVLIVGLLASLTELVSENLLSLSVSLAVALLAGYQVYQRSQGERSLREATLADQKALNLAVQFGYSLSQAYNSLHDALQTLSNQTSQKSLWRKYRVRLQVLEICAERKRSHQAIRVGKVKNLSEIDSNIRLIKQIESNEVPAIG